MTTISTSLLINHHLSFSSTSYLTMALVDPSILSLNTGLVSAPSASHHHLTFSALLFASPSGDSTSSRTSTHCETTLHSHLCCLFRPSMSLPLQVSAVAASFRPSSVHLEPEHAHSLFFTLTPASLNIMELGTKGTQAAMGAQDDGIMAGERRWITARTRSVVGARFGTCAGMAFTSQAFASLVLTDHEHMMWWTDRLRSRPTMSLT
jgi:hypothetical protein